MRPDSREGFCQEEFESWLDHVDTWPDDDYDDDVNDVDDGQPDEYTEWQDYMGGDDWDQGQYDNGDF